VKTIAVLVGGRSRGTNMAALVEAGREGAFAAQVVRVIAAQAEAPALGLARSMGVETVVAGDDETLLGAFDGVDRICLAGYLRLLPTEVLARWPGRVLNIHPSLLPKYGGQGMYGMHVHRAVLAARETESGCTVHRVTAVYDEGEIVVQHRCPVLPGDTEKTLAERVLALEHRAYPEAVRREVDRYGR